MTIKKLNEEFASLLAKYNDQPEVQKDIKQVIGIVADTIGEVMTLAMLNVKKGGRE